MDALPVADYWRQGTSVLAGATLMSPRRTVGIRCPRGYVVAAAVPAAGAGPAGVLALPGAGLGGLHVEGSGFPGREPFDALHGRR